ncbi:hypothetical protein [Longimicrobium sp.]|uniref:hypothetical protein n=1 Tax=Longimicrobium sp. TaxID=2029185 RepID=UPI002CFDD60D|nr:hypothetical protein [Longimicrobium sp.]HSU17945.1 hypothetical protein [Longimicrobium sp.]
MRTLRFIPLALLAAAAACSDQGGSPTAPGRTPTPPSAALGPVAGAIFTTGVACTGTNVNIFGSKADVYVDGGPAHTGAAGLPDGDYYVQVTEPGGTLLGTSVGSAAPTPVHVAGGEFASCYQLQDIVFLPPGLAVKGFNTTSNPGGEYKVWVSKDAGFDPSASKTDNFKVKEDPITGTLHVRKFYDANANGLDDDAQPVTGWKVRIQDGLDWTRYTPVDVLLEQDTYTVTEFMPVETNWMATTATSAIVSLPPDATVTFGNLCVGAGGGLTLGFWSNKNGQSFIDAADLAMLTALNLRNANGTGFDPANYAGFRSWILSATATNMAYMLSAQLAAMELNVFNGKVNGGSLIYAPGSTSANALGFAAVNAVMAEANTELGAHGVATDGSAFRSYQEALKNALDRGNNNLNFVQATPCAFTFAP